jgi:hypothetical protein
MTFRKLALLSSSGKNREEGTSQIRLAFSLFLPDDKSRVSFQNVVFFNK